MTSSDYKEVPTTEPNSVLQCDDHSRKDDTEAQQSGSKDRIPARLVLYFLSWSGFLVSFMMRNDINFAIVVMVRGANETIANNTNSSAVSKTTTNINEIGEFEWSTTVQSLIVGSFYWCYVLSQVVGGVATQYFGTKNVFGWSQCATAVCSLFIPMAATYHYSALIVLRSIQGFASGLTWPAMYAVVGYWIPSLERSRFMSSFQGFSIGIGLTYPLCGFLISHWGWRIVFYTTGSIGLAWCVMWYFLAFNTPEDHPRISTNEFNYIKKNIDHDVQSSLGMPVPWLSIFKSLPAWSIGITTFGRIWVHYTFIMSGPMYMKNILGLDTQKNGLLSGAPFLLSYLSSVLFCWIADLLVRHHVFSLTNVRKIFTASSQVLPGILVLLVGYVGNDIWLVLIIWFVAVALITASYAGAMASIVDIAPNLAGPVLAFAQTIHMTASFLSPIVSGLIVKDVKDIEQWQIAFTVASVVACITYIVFQVYGTSEIQPWNYPPKKLYSNMTTVPLTSTNGANGNMLESTNGTLNNHHLHKNGMTNGTSNGTLHGTSNGTSNKH